MSVILVSKDINLRIKASISGLIAEDYENDRALDDFSLLFTGVSALPEDFGKSITKTYVVGMTKAAHTTKSHCRKKKNGIPTNISTFKVKKTSNCGYFKF